MRAILLLDGPLAHEVRTAPPDVSFWTDGEHVYHVLSFGDARVGAHCQELSDQGLEEW